MRSNTVQRGFERAPYPGLFKAADALRSDCDPSFIGVCCSYVDSIPRHVHLHAFGQVAREAVNVVGSVPFDFN